MSRKEKSRIDTSGGNALGANPFDALGALAGLPSQGSKTPVAPAQQAKEALAANANTENTAAENAAAGDVHSHGADAIALPSAAGQQKGSFRFSGRVDVRREKSGRGGKTVTVIAGEGIAALAEAEREALLRQLKNQFGCGGSLQGQGLELQGNRVDQIMPVLVAMGWRAVRSGG